jgi:hypothetical protein
MNIKENEIDITMASTCIRWLVTAYPTPLLESQNKDKKSKNILNNKEKFGNVLSNICKLLPTVGDTNDIKKHILAHYTQLLVSVIKQNINIDINTKVIKNKNEKNNSLNPMDSFKKSLDVSIKDYARVVANDPYSIVTVWAFLGTFIHISRKCICIYI